MVPDIVFTSSWNQLQHPGFLPGREVSIGVRRSGLEANDLVQATRLIHIYLLVWLMCMTLGLD